VKITDIGDRKVDCLTPAKLSGFYKAVGGDYDGIYSSKPSLLDACSFCATALFVKVPDPNISFIYQSIGCQHTLQPTINDFAPPSIPALTSKGFVRWQSIETLLGPQEHVPYLQYAVAHFNLKHPDTGEAFPVELPKEAFPLVPDPEIEKWHAKCAEKLKPQEDSPEASYRRVRNFQSSSTLPGHGEVRYGYVHVKWPGLSKDPGLRPSEDYFTSKPIRRSKTGVENPNYSRPREPERRRSRTSPPEPPSRGRRRSSVPENLYSPAPDVPDSPLSPHDGLRPPSETHRRRHSHPRHGHRSSSSSSSSSSDESPAPSPGPQQRRHSSQPFGAAAAAAGEIPGVRYGPAIQRSHPYSAPSLSHPTLAPTDGPSARRRGLSVPDVEKREKERELRDRYPERYPERDRNRYPQRDKDRERERDRDRDKAHTFYKVSPSRPLDTTSTFPLPKLAKVFSKDRLHSHSHSHSHDNEHSRSPAGRDKGSVRWRDLLGVKIPQRGSKGDMAEGQEKEDSGGSGRDGRSGASPEKEKYRRDEFRTREREREGELDGEGRRSSSYDARRRREWEREVERGGTR
jgi:hypothetical protein